MLSLGATITFESLPTSHEVKHRRLDCPSTFAMPRFRKSKQPTDVSISIPTPPAELVQDLASRRDPQALAVSSTAIALSIGSPFHHARDMSSDSATDRGRDTGWQTAYGAARMAIEIAKESSDMFLPLKAVAAAISVLIRNYDVSVSRQWPGHPFISYLLLVAANIGQCEYGERD